MKKKHIILTRRTNSSSISGDSVQAAELKPESRTEIKIQTFAEESFHMSMMTFHLSFCSYYTLHTGTVREHERLVISALPTLQCDSKRR